MIKVKKYILIFLSVLFISIITLVGISISYEKEVKAYMIDELNKRLRAKVIVDSDNINFSLLKGFPFASLTFKDIIMLGAPMSKINEVNKGNAQVFKSDTLFSLNDLSLRFNIIDILLKKYAVKKIMAKGGFVSLKIRQNGSLNWDVWSQSTDTTSESESSAFKLEKFDLKNVSISYLDARSQVSISSFVSKGSFGGEFTSSEYDLGIYGDMLVESYVVNEVNYLDNKPVKVNLNLKVDSEKNLYSFTDATVFISDIEVQVEGKYMAGDPSDQIDVFFKTKDLDIESAFSILPEKYFVLFKDYESKGEFYFNAHVAGKTDDVNRPVVKVDFGITKTDIMHLSSGIVLKDVHLLGSYYNAGSKDYLDIKSFSTQTINGNISGSIRLDNTDNPIVNASLKANMPLENIRQLTCMDTLWNYPLQSMSGSVNINFTYKGRLKESSKYVKSDFDNMIFSGDLSFVDAGLKIRNSNFSLDSISGSLLFNNNSITINSLSGKTKNSDFYFKGELNNVLSYYLSDRASLSVAATFQSNFFDLNEFLLDQHESTKRDTVYRISFSPLLNFNLKTDIGKFTFRKFEANNLRGNFVLKNKKLIGDPIVFSTMDGAFEASGMVDGENDSLFLITCDAKLKKININKLFYQFENFSQNTLTQANLKGLITADVQFASIWTSDLTVDLNRIYAKSNLTIEKGELINFEPLKALSKYVAVSELQSIKFETLQNQIEIKDQKIFIPKMDIKSNALDLSLAGTHSFENVIDYHVKVLLSDLLFQKARKAKKENTEFGVVEDDKSGRTSLFISMTGPADNPTIKYDKQSAKQNFKENVAEEKHSLKQILKEEFGWFKKDTTLKKDVKPKDSGKFIIKWDEEDKKEKRKKEDEDF